tara:strand:- start:5564 stop:6262 length:699 start_codon:yes stop_codon:yes gene_type:complete
MIKSKQKGFALVLSLVLLLVMSLMGGGLVVIASSDHEGNNSSDHYQQTFYVAETALMQAEKSLIDKMMGPVDSSGVRQRAQRYVPRNGDINNDGTADDAAPEQTPCYRSFRNLSRESSFQVVEQLQDQSFYDLIAPIFSDTKKAALTSIDAEDKREDAFEKEEEFIQKFRYEFFSVNSGSSVFKGSGMSLKKTSTTSQKKGTAYKIYGCGMMGNANNPEILVPLEKIIILAH